MFGLLDRRSDLTRDQFRQHWRTTHAVEALKLNGFFNGYIQNHGADTDLPGFARACDGVPEIWFHDPAHISAMHESDAYLSGAYVDEPNFMDGRARGVMAHDLTRPGQPDLAGTERALKAIVFVKRWTTQSFDAFAAWYGQQTMPVMDLAVPPRRHLRALAVDTGDPTAPPLFDAVEEYWWPNQASFEQAWRTGMLTEEATPMIDQANSAGLLCEEVHVYWPEGGVSFG